MKRETIANVRKRAVREIKEGSQDTTCLRLGVHINGKGNVLGWGGSSLKTAYENKKVNEGNNKNTYKELRY